MTKQFSCDELSRHLTPARVDMIIFEKTTLFRVLGLEMFRHSIVSKPF